MMGFHRKIALGSQALGDIKPKMLCKLEASLHDPPEDPRRVKDTPCER